MESITKRLDKKDISYLATLLFFAIIAMFRYFDKKLRNHDAVFSFMEEYPVAIFMMFLYFAILFVFYVVLIAYSKQESKRTMHYLTAFLSVFAFPMFLPKYYFGNMDMYVWMLGLISCVIFVVNKATFLTIVLCAFMGYISPVATLCCGVMVVILYLYRYLAIGKKRDLLIASFSVLSGGGAALVSIVINGLNEDLQKVLSVEHFWISIILFVPYVLIAFLFFKGVIEKSNMKKRIGWIVLIIGALPAMIANYVIGDYARVLVYVFMYFICTISILMSLQDEEVEKQMCEVKEIIKRHVPIPVVVIVYPLLITTFWIAGPITLYKEKFLGN